MSVSWWRRATVERKRADVCIVGAGAAGLGAAIACEREGLSVIVLDRHTPGAGASTRNAGYLMRGAAGSYAWAVREWGRDTARDLWRWTEDNLTRLIELGVERCESFQRIPSCLLALEQTEADELEASYELMQGDGFDAPLIRAGDDAAWANRNPILGLVNPGDGAVNSASLVSLLRSRVSGELVSGAEVFEIKEFEIEESGDRVLVRAADTEVTCSHAIVCTNAHTASVLPALGSRIEPNRGQMLAMRVPTDLRLHASYYMNHGHEYVRLAQPGLIVAGGKRSEHAGAERTDNPEPTPELQADLEAFTRSLLGLAPNEAPVVARWAGTMGFTPDSLPIVGSVTPGSRIVACAGFTGHGMSLGIRCAEMAVRGITNGEWPGVLSPARFSSQAPA